ncbi:hypothetical protein [Pedobacter frigoris]|uniref:Uncharacterized protein n=1 Tax=Pedobacter frigoris TaxID=2571272 RepID=A0A4U1CCP2_9SPHI|nr:hypothetical protein [Pedobacter frigoris]TKC03940.1 hypothetical protein FA047_18505 [Pedobacter frigoris]
MNKMIQLVLMLALCLNFCFGQVRKNSPPPSTTRTYVYSFRDYKSGYKMGYRLSRDEVLKGRIIAVSNHTIAQLFALALRLENQKQIAIEVREPEKLKRKYCYKLVVPYHHQDDFYILMLKSLNDEFPEYDVKKELRDKKYFMVIRDKIY